jgi:hypothetical protein
MITLLYILLALFTLITGFLIASLPALNTTVMPWLSLLVLTALYSWVALLFLRKKGERGATLWVLHWVPFLLVILWALLQLLTNIGPEFLKVSQWYSVLWTLPGVLLAYVVYAFFGLSSGDKMPLRMLLLFLTIIPFIGLNIANSNTNMQELATANSLWNNPSHRTMQASTIDINVPQFGDTDTPGDTDSIFKDNEPVVMDNQLADRLANLLGEDSLPTVTPIMEEKIIAPVEPVVEPTIEPEPVAVTIPAPTVVSPVKPTPPKLSSSGPGLNLLLLLLGIGYIATLHSRIVQRRK